MSKLFHRSSILALALVLSLCGNALLASAETLVPLDKHARKIQHKLGKYEQGSYLHLVMSNSTDAYGALGSLSDASFTFTTADNNSTATYRYNEVSAVKTDNERIGHGAEPIHIRHFRPIIITAAAVVAGALTYNAMR
jgi:hypothetical protein